jgi:hypothetical protein
MQITVSFRGVMLFRTQRGASGDFLEDVLLPDCDGTRPPEGSGFAGGYLHLDGTRATPHYAGLLLAKGSGSATNISIRGAEVHIHDGGASNVHLGGSVASIADLASVTPPGSATRLVVRPSAVVGARVRVSAGSMPTVHQVPSDYDFAFGTIVPLTLGFTLTFASSITVDVTQSGVVTPPLKLSDGDRLYVYNYDDPNPTEDQLTRQHATADPFVIDHDFKWLYALVQPQNGDTLAKWAMGYLPAPFWPSPTRAPSGIRTISVSTCFPARF